MAFAPQVRVTDDKLPLAIWIAGPAAPQERAGRLQQVAQQYNSRSWTVTWDAGAYASADVSALPALPSTWMGFRGSPDSP